MYRATTDSISVTVKPIYLEEQSSPTESHYVWAYQVRIENTGGETVQLISRHWTITDGTGQVEEVRGLGVVGDQPVLEPGESYEYTSGCPLPTPFGSMEGSYQFVTAGGGRFEARIARFELRDAGAIH